MITPADTVQTIPKPGRASRQIAAPPGSCDVHFRPARRLPWPGGLRQAPARTPASCCGSSRPASTTATTGCSPGTPNPPHTQKKGPVTAGGW